MNISLAFILNESQVIIKALNGKDNTVKEKKIDIISLPDEEIDSIYFSETIIENSNISNIIEKEQKFIPTHTFESLEISPESFESYQYDHFFSLFQKSSSRWILANNLNTIENSYQTISYLKDLYIKDRNNFFEELWFVTKQTLATQELNIIFHDLKEPTEKQSEKGEKPKLCYSYVSGKKVPNLLPGKEKENLIMADYEKEFTRSFNITEFNAEKGQLIACAKIDLSPVLVMAKLPSFNPIQKAVLTSIFTGLQKA